MTDNQSPDARPIAALRNPGPISRARFFASRYPVAIAIPLSLLVAFAAATAIVSALDLLPAKRLPAALYLTSISLVAIGAVMFTAIARMHRPASSNDIAAAIMAATERERPHLLTAIEARLMNKYCRDPITVMQLVTMFDEVRAAHGERAHRRQLRQQAAHAEQEKSLAQLSMRQ
ncbi:MAG: hypothetical protein HC834_05020 [Rhodospirillales bacterium]|nr:hypothetical protein [Rhodospirillales bacterium]